MGFDLSQQLSRRTLLGTAAALPLLGKQEPKRIAMITTVYRYFRTASTWVIASRWVIRTMARGICRAKIVSVGQKLGIVLTQFLLTPEPNVTYSTCLMNKTEEMFVSGRVPYPVERTLLTSGMTEVCHKSYGAGGKRLETPELS